MKPGENGELILETPEEIYHTFRALEDFELDLAENISASNVNEAMSMVSDTGASEVVIPATHSRVALVGLELYTGGRYRYSYETGAMLNDFHRKMLRS